MPIVHVYMLEGRDEEKKRKMMARVTDAVAESLEAPRESIRVLIVEMPKEHFGIGGVSVKDLGR